MAEEGASSSPEAERQTVSVGVLLRQLYDDVRDVVHQRLHLFTLEVRQAGLAFAQIVALAFLSALVLCAAWLTLLFGVYKGAIEWGLAWPWAWALVMLVNGLATVALWLRAQGLTRKLSLPATLRTLRSGTLPGEPVRTPPSSSRGTSANSTEPGP